MDLHRLQRAIHQQWRDSIVERLAAYVRIPNESPAFDPEWERRGHMDAAVELMADWCRAQPIDGLSVQVQRIPGVTPLLRVEVPGELPGCVLLYGHFDKQPAFTGWLPGLGPWQPAVRDGKLYGRGAADDGYAVFSALTAIAALKAQKVPLARCVLLIEGSEESGSIHLPVHLEALGTTLGDPSLIVCLDAECGNYEQLWCTTSLRGSLAGRLSVRVLTAGLHSGAGTGIAPTPFRIAQQLLARLEDPTTGALLPEALRVTVPEDRKAEIAAAARLLGNDIAGRLPFAPGVQALSDDPVELLLNNTWRATLAVTGADGLPAVQSAGNVLLPEVTLKLSLRLPPTCDAAQIAAVVRQSLERDPPYRSQVRFEPDAVTSGWNAPAFAAWLEQSIERASQAIFARPAVRMGDGGTIPFMNLLGRRFPDTQFFVTGVLGPRSNAHGPNEFLHLDYAQRLTACVACVLAAHGDQAARD